MQLYSLHIQTLIQMTVNAYNNKTKKRLATAKHKTQEWGKVAEFRWYKNDYR